MPRSKKISVTSIPIRKLSLTQILNMYDLFCKYYENADQRIFMEDMSTKERVFLLKEKIGGKIVGFSTLKKVKFLVEGKPTIGLFSGDTILEKHYWGDKSLHMGMFRYMVKLKICNPITSVYWLLISKGYKTYLLLTNNFTSYYPRFDFNKQEKLKKENKTLNSVVIKYCELLFPKAFNKDNMLLDFGNEYQHLKQNIADITPEMRAKSPKIDFFEKINPNWKKGVELPCIAEVSFYMLSCFAIKMIKRFVNNNYNRKPISTTADVESTAV